MKRLKEYRKSKGIKQEELANHLKISRSAYSHYETGTRKMDPETLTKICMYLDISADYLLGHIDEPMKIHEMQFIRDLENGETDQELLEKYIFELGDEDLTKEEMKKMLKIVRALSED